MPFLFIGQYALFFAISFYCFFSRLWQCGLLMRLLLTVFPFAWGWFSIFILCHSLSAAQLKIYHQYIFTYTIFISLSLLPQWYKLMWSLLRPLSARPLSDGGRLLAAITSAALMIIAIVLFFTFYYLWIDALAGYTQGLRSAQLHYQPILLDKATAFYFSFVTYFTLGYGDLIPYGHWFHLLVFLECIISLLNTGIIIIYIYNLLFSSQLK